MGKIVDFDIETIFNSDVDVKEPSQYRVLLHNDDYTSMEFVIEVLISIFRMDETKATKIMLNIHNKGIGECGIYTYDIARTKVEQVHLLAKANGFPLRASFENE